MHVSSCTPIIMERLISLWNLKLRASYCVLTALFSWLRVPLLVIPFWSWNIFGYVLICNKETLRRSFMKNTSPNVCHNYSTHPWMTNMSIECYWSLCVLIWEDLSYFLSIQSSVKDWTYRDYVPSQVCRKCGLLGYYSYKLKKGICSTCKNGDNISTVKLPYACKLLIQVQNISICHTYPAAKFFNGVLRTRLVNMLYSARDVTGT